MNRSASRGHLESKKRFVLAVLLLSAPLLATAEVRYVAPAGGDVSPYTNWLTAATTIQAAVDASIAGDFIWVTDGVYRVGARVTPGGSLSNRVVITNDITLQSVNGPSVTAIEGAGPLGSNAVRCVFMTAGRLEGFTLTNGFTRTTGNQSLNCTGGGLHATNALIVNCRLEGNRAGHGGGGVRGGSLTNCVVAGNSASNYGGGAYFCGLGACLLSGNEALYGGGASDSALSRCVLSNNLARGTGTGGAAYLGVLSNCTVVGNTAYHGGGAHGGTLYDCTVTHNSASNLGGGLLSCTAFNCTLAGNSAGGGGGAREGTLNNCVIHGNSATGEGGGLDNSTALNCTITDNAAGSAGGGSTLSSLRNCIVYHNRASLYPNTYYGYSYQCCILPHTLNDFGSLAVDPMLLSFSHIASNSPCVAAGTLNTGVRFDVDGEPWGNPPSIGCDEPGPASATGALVVAVRPETTQAVVGATVRLVGETTGVPGAVDWQFGDGQAATHSAFVAHAWTTAGTYQVVFTARNADYPSGVTSSVSIRILDADQTATFVSTNAPHPGAPYNAWTNAAHTLQEAVDAQVYFGGRVWVTNGLYAEGGRTTPGGVSLNRLVITNPVRVASVNGPSVTTIVGQQAADPTSNVRCVFMSAGRLEGFSLVGGATPAASSQKDLDLCGGGVNAPGGILSNCVIAGNQCWEEGGGANFGTYYNCVFSGNVARSFSGAVDWGVLFDCTVVSNRVTSTGTFGGGGIGGGSAYRCRLTGNAAAQVAGAYFAALVNCVVETSLNASGGPGAGVGRSHLWNCTVVSNGIGVMFGTHWENTIAYHNNANYSGSATPFQCCTWPHPGGVGNITNAPLFLDAAAGNYRLQYLSPCIDTGLNGLWTTGTTDLDGQLRVVGGTVDLGAYEMPADSDGDGLSEPWEQHYAGGLTNLFAGGDWDGDGSLDEQEMRAGTDPADAASVLRLVAADVQPDGAGVIVQWASEPGRVYALRGAPYAVAGLPGVLQSNLAAVAPVNVFTAAALDAVQFFRVELQVP